MTKIKLCGLMHEKDALAANEARPDWVGLVFDAGRHFVSDETAAMIRKALNPSIPAVGVFVNEDPAHILSLVERGTIQYVQLHGGESEAYIKALKRSLSCPIIRVVSVKQEKMFSGRPIRKRNTCSSIMERAVQGNPSTGATSHSLISLGLWRAELDCQPGSGAVLPSVCS